MKTLQNLNFTQKILLAVTVQFLLLFSLIGNKLFTVGTGQTVLLKIQPVDPRDPFRGDYMTIRYDISRINAYNYMNNSTQQFSVGDTVYVPLIVNSSYAYNLSGPVARINKQNDDIVYVKGTITKINYTSRNNRGPQSQQVDSYNISYGIEEYFIPENTGRTVQFNGVDDYAEVVIDENGNAVLKQLYLDNQPWP